MIDTKESITAKICSYARAYHSNFEKNKVFDDYLAYDIMGKEEYEEIEALIYEIFDVTKISNGFENFKQSIMEYVSPIPLSRIRYAEEKLLQFAEIHGECQYVICGAGVDTFAFRNINRNIQIFEIDHPNTQSYKLERISQLEWNIPENVHYVPVDFETDNMKDALMEEGFDPNKKTFFSILGVSYYLTLPVFEEMIQDISKLSTSENRIVFDYPDETSHKSGSETERFGRIAAITANFGEIMRQGFSFHSLETALAKHGFIVEEHMTPEKIQSTIFNNSNSNYRAFDNVHFISAAKEQD